jgi:Ca2+/Na+ antiporter
MFQALKARIRRLRATSRILSFLISIAVFIPISLTLQKFMSTQNIYHDVIHPDGSTQWRTAWAKDSKVWPTWMYFLTAGISVFLNFLIIIAYACSGVEKANRAATVATIFSWGTVLGNLIVWCVAAGLYRAEKDTGEKPKDLWGWTCSPAATAIQKEFAGEVDFNKFCNIQVRSLKQLCGFERNKC